MSNRDDMQLASETDPLAPSPEKKKRRAKRRAKRTLEERKADAAKELAIVEEKQRDKMLGALNSASLSLRAAETFARELSADNRADAIVKLRVEIDSLALVEE